MTHDQNGTYRPGDLLIGAAFDNPSVRFVVSSNRDHAWLINRFRKSGIECLTNGFLRSYTMTVHCVG
jgi:hypothetical protein